MIQDLSGGSQIERSNFSCARSLAVVLISSHRCLTDTSTPSSDATSPASIIVRAYESWADDENQCFVVTSTFASKKGGNENSPFGASTKSVVVPARGTDLVTPSSHQGQVQVQ